MAKATKQKKSGAKSKLKKNTKIVKPKAVNALKKKKESMAKKSDLNKKKVKTKTRVTKTAPPKKTVVKVTPRKKHAKATIKTEFIPEVKTRTIESIKGYSKKDLE